MLRILVQGPHLENHWLKKNSSIQEPHGTWKKLLERDLSCWCHVAPTRAPPGLARGMGRSTAPPLRVLPILSCPRVSLLTPETAISTP